MARSSVGGHHLWAVLLWVVLGVGVITAQRASLADPFGRDKEWPSLVTFGDSMTDTGNLFRLSNGTYPSPMVYFQGRFTNANGTWVDAVQRRSRGQVFNHAIGGANCCRYNLTGLDALVPSMAAQVDAYVNRSDRPKGKKVVVLWGGHMDIIGSLALSTGQFPVGAKRVMGCLMVMADKLLRSDEDATVLVASLAPIYTAPALLGSLGPYVGAFVEALNGVIHVGTLALGLRYPNRIAFWDISKVMKDATAAATAGGFTHVQEPCVKYKSAMVGLGNYTQVVDSICSDPEDYAYYDPLHPTSRFHEIIASSYIKQLQQLKLIPILITI